MVNGVEVVGTKSGVNGRGEVDFFLAIRLYDRRQPLHKKG